MGRWRVAHVLTSEEATAKGRISDDGNAKFLGCLEESNLLIFNVKSERRIFDLQGSDRMDGVGTTQSSSGALREAEVPNFARPIIHMPYVICEYVK